MLMSDTHCFNTLGSSKVYSLLLTMTSNTTKSNNLWFCRDDIVLTMNVFKIAQKYSILEVVDCTFTNNSASSGGAILAKVGKELLV